ncbi:MAG: hypothetical protein PHT40_01490 [Patescibacteria group bacterium]|nr:hypothetical protein [Patescibacteria group bacterium]
MKNFNLKSKVAPVVLFATVLALTGFSTTTAAQSQKIENVMVTEYANMARISWQTSQPVVSQLYFGDSSENYDTFFTDEYLSRDHAILVRALDAGTPYYFKITANSSNSYEKPEYFGNLKTLGEKPNLVVYQPYFTLLFEDGWKNINGINPIEIKDVDGLNFTQPGFTGYGFQVTRPKTYLQYSCDNVFSSGYGAVTAWLSFDRFDKSAVIWQTDDSRYALYYEVGGVGADFYKRIVARAGGNKVGEMPEVAYVLQDRNSSANKWGLNEWHFIAMTWDGKFSGKLSLYIDGRRIGETEYADATGCSTFRVGNNYREDLAFTVGKIDELKLHQWAMGQYYVYQNYLAYSSSKNFAKKGTKDTTGVIAGAAVRNFKVGKMIKNADGRIYLIGRDNTKIHVSDVYALSKLGNKRVVIEVTDEELTQYADGGNFYSWSRYPDGTMLKGSGKTVYWIWDGEKRPLASEAVFNRYGNDWNDLIVISDDELASYPLGFMYY